MLPACRTHMAPNHTAFPFPRALFEKFVRENNGRQAPLSVEGPRTPLYPCNAHDIC